MVSDSASSPSVYPLDLQFDHALAADGTPVASQAANAVPCATCGTAIVDHYFRAGRKQVCERCKAAIEAHAIASGAELRTPRQTARAFMFGLGAAILGAILYYAVIAITGFEIGYVALAIGYGVGYAIRKATRERGARRFQIMAVVLTYVAVGLAYVPLAFGNVDREAKAVASHATVARDTVQATALAPSPSASHPATSAKPRGEDSGSSIALGMLVLLASPLVLPILMILQSLPGGLITAIIIAVGMRQAWRMTAPAEVAISGPFRVASKAPAAA